MGSLGWEVSALGFGAMRLPTRRKSMLSRVKREEAVKIIRSGFDQGITYIDTAWPYHFGGSERAIGEALKDGYREKVIIVNKSPIFLIRKAEDFDKYLQVGLDRMDVDYIDIYLFHGLNRKNWQKVKELNLLKKMEEARDKGLIKYIGFSFHDTLPVFKEIIDYYDWDVCQIQHNYMDVELQATSEGLKYAHEKDIAVIVMQPVKGGQLANPPQEALDVMAKAKNKRTPVDWALQFLWNLPEVSVVISGMGSQQMVDENCRSADKSGINSLDEDDLKIINELAEIYRKNILVPCTTCNYCMPCPYGVNIPDNFALLNNYNQDKGLRKWMTRGKYKRLASKEKHVNLEIPNGDATICTECNECIEKCPQEIQIPDELKKVHAILGKKEEISDHF